MAESLTGQELSEQGLSRGRFNNLNKAGREYINERVLSSRKIEKLNQIIQVTRAVASTSGNLKGTTKAILLDKQPELRKFVILIVNDYRKAKRKVTILEFFKNKYKGKVPEMLSKVKAKKLDCVMVQPETDLSEGDRATELAVLISQWEDRTPEIILETERDVIRKIMQIADQNKEKALVDSDICLGAEDMISDGKNPTEFPLETLAKENRDELVKRALKFKECRKR